MKRIKSTQELIGGEYLLIQSIGGTDMWAIGRLHSIGKKSLYLSYNDDCVQGVSIEHANEGEIYIIEIHT
jgi:hypothetical protein